LISNGNESSRRRKKHPGLVEGLTAVAAERLPLPKPAKDALRAAGRLTTRAVTATMDKTRIKSDERILAEIDSTKLQKEKTLGQIRNLQAAQNHRAAVERENESLSAMKLVETASLIIAFSEAKEAEPDVTLLTDMLGAVYLSKERSAGDLRRDFLFESIHEIAVRQSEASTVKQFSFVGNLEAALTEEESSRSEAASIKGLDPIGEVDVSLASYAVKLVHSYSAWEEEHYPVDISGTDQPLTVLEPDFA
jgi:hypothetical protein